MRTPRVHIPALLSGIVLVLPLAAMAAYVTSRNAGSSEVSVGCRAFALSTQRSGPEAAADAERRCLRGAQL